MALVLGTVRRVTNIRTTNSKEEEDNLGKEPCPATALLPTNVAAAAALLARGGAVDGARLGIQVIRLDGDNVVVVAQLARLGAEAEVGNVGNLRRAIDVEAADPVVLVLVLQVELEVLVLKVRQAHLGGHAGVADPARRAARQLAVLAVIVLVVRLGPVSVHRHDVGEHDAGAVVLVRVDKDAQPVEPVGAAKHGADLPALPRDPHGEPVAKQLVLAGNLELDLNLPVGGRQGHAREEPSRLRGAVRGKADVAVCVPVLAKNGPFVQVSRR